MLWRLKKVHTAVRLPAIPCLCMAETTSSSVKSGCFSISVSSHCACASNGDVLPPRGLAAQLPVSRKHFTHLTAALGLMSSCSAASRREAPPSTRAITRMRMSTEYAFGMVRPPDESMPPDSPIYRSLGILRFYSARTCSSAARGQDRLGVHRRRDRAAVQRRWPSWNCDTVCDRAFFAHAYLRNVRRRRVRTLGLLTILPALHWIGVLPARVSARALGPEPLAQAPRRQAGTSPGRELAGGARERGAADEGFGADHGRYHRAAQGHHLPNRCEAFARRDQGANPTGQEARRAAAAIVCAHRQARRHDGRALCPCQTVQPPPSTAAHIAHPPRQAH